MRCISISQNKAIEIYTKHKARSDDAICVTRWRNSFCTRRIMLTGVWISTTSRTFKTMPRSKKNVHIKQQAKHFILLSRYFTEASHAKFQEAEHTTQSKCKNTRQAALSCRILTTQFLDRWWNSSYARSTQCKRLFEKETLNQRFSLAERLETSTRTFHNAPRKHTLTQITNAMNVMLWESRSNKWYA